MKPLYLVFSLFSLAFSFIARADQNDFCFCQAFPGNYPGVALYLVRPNPDAKNDGKDKTWVFLRMFNLDVGQNPTNIRPTVDKCAEVAKQLTEIKICVLN